MASTTIGLDPNRVTPNPEFGINSFGEQSDKAFVYVKINGAVGEAGEVIVIANDGLAHPITTSFDLIGRRVGIAPSAAAIGTYCWLLVRGESRFLVAANCDAHSSLRATTVGGVVDDFGSGPVIEGLFSTENNGAMQGLVGWAARSSHVCKNEGRGRWRWGGVYLPGSHRHPGSVRDSRAGSKGQHEGEIRGSLSTITAISGTESYRTNLREEPIHHPQPTA